MENKTYEQGFKDGLKQGQYKSKSKVMELINEDIVMMGKLVSLLERCADKFPDDDPLSAEIEETVNKYKSFKSSAKRE